MAFLTRSSISRSSACGHLGWYWLFTEWTKYIIHSCWQQGVEDIRVAVHVAKRWQMTYPIFHQWMMSIKMTINREWTRRGRCSRQQCWFPYLYIRPTWSFFFAVFKINLNFMTAVSVIGGRNLVVPGGCPRPPTYIWGTVSSSAWYRGCGGPA